MLDGGHDSAHIEARDVSRTFGIAEEGLNIAALNGVSFKVRQGEFVAILGPSGAGKSTLLHLLGGLDKPTSGSIVIHGVSLAGLDERGLTMFRRKNLGFVFQAFNLLPTLSVFENISVPYLIEGKRDSDAQDRVLDLIELFGLRGRESRLSSRLSMGEQQRVALARAVLTQPALIIADEPTGSVDSATGNEILQLLWESCDNFGQTILLATNHPRLAAFADRVLFLNDGEIISELELGRREDHSDAKPILDRLQALGI